MKSIYSSISSSYGVVLSHDSSFMVIVSEKNNNLTVFDMKKHTGVLNLDLWFPIKDVSFSKNSKKLILELKVLGIRHILKRVKDYLRRYLFKIYNTKFHASQLVEINFTGNILAKYVIEDYIPTTINYCNNDSEFIVDKNGIYRPFSLEATWVSLVL